MKLASVSSHESGFPPRVLLVYSLYQEPLFGEYSTLQIKADVCRLSMQSDTSVGFLTVFLHEQIYRTVISIEESAT